MALKPSASCTVFRFCNPLFNKMEDRKRKYTQQITNIITTRTKAIKAPAISPLPNENNRENCFTISVPFEASNKRINPPTIKPVTEINFVHLLILSRWLCVVLSIFISNKDLSCSCSINNDFGFDKSQAASRQAAPNVVIF